MDGNRFDELARRFAGAGAKANTGTRRSLLKAAAGGIAAVVAGARGGADAQACRQVANRCAAARPCCAGLQCVAGVCAPQPGQPACAAPGQACGGALACCPGTTCAGGACCPAALACGGACCAGGTLCVRGVCQSPGGGTGCPAGQTLCGAAGCRDLAGDPANCGSCGRACPGGVCEGGVCGASDGAACSAGGQCRSGFCVGGVCCAQGSCAGFDGACTVGVCQAGTGQCAARPKEDGTGCGGGDACTEGSTCRGGACVPGGAIACPPLDPSLDPRCAGVACDPVGGCETTFAAANTACDNATRCDGREVCDGAGHCLPAAPGQTVVCPPCRTCNPATGECDPDDALTCSGFAPCSTFGCDGGECVATSTCGPCESCFEGRCSGGPCDDCGNRCDRDTEACVEGICKTRNGFGCVDPDDCRSGFCAGGVCCGSACDGDCESCNFPGGTPGLCVDSPAGFPCGGGLCNGAGVCCDPGPESAAGDGRCGPIGTCCGDPALPCCPGAGCCPDGACFRFNDPSSGPGYLCCPPEDLCGSGAGQTCCLNGDTCFNGGCIDPRQICDDLVNPKVACPGRCCPRPGGGTTCCGQGETCTAAGCIAAESAVCTTNADCAAFGVSCVGWRQVEGVRVAGSGRCCGSPCPIEGFDIDGPYEVCCTGNSGCCEGSCRPYPGYTCAGCGCSFRSITGR